MKRDKHSEFVEQRARKSHGSYEGPTGIGANTAPDGKMNQPK